MSIDEYSWHIWEAQYEASAWYTNAMHEKKITRRIQTKEKDQNQRSSVQKPKIKKEVYNMLQRLENPTQTGKQTPSSPRKRAKVAWSKGLVKMWYMSLPLYLSTWYKTM